MFQALSLVSSFFLKIFQPKPPGNNSSLNAGSLSSQPILENPAQDDQNNFPQVALRWKSKYRPPKVFTTSLMNEKKLARTVEAPIFKVLSSSSNDSSYTRTRKAKIMRVCGDTPRFSRASNRCTIVHDRRRHSKFSQIPHGAF